MVAVVGAVFLILLVSYGHIAATVLKIRSVEGRRKAFHPCASHLTVVTLLFGTALFHVPAAQLQLLVWQRQGGICILLTGDPHAGPLIYSSRNKEIKDALPWKMLGRSVFPGYLTEDICLQTARDLGGS